MHRSVKIAAIAGIGLSLSSFTSLPGFSAAALDALNPSRVATFFCGATRGGSALARELLIASAFAAPASEGGRIPLFADLTTSPFPVSTRDAQARQYFSQGLLLTYGFNHAGAVRSFREAQRLDPKCAICWWGEAVALGMIAALRVGVAQGTTQPASVARLTRLLDVLGLPTDLDARLSEQALDFIESDKKKSGARVRFVVPGVPGDTTVVPLTLDTIRAAVASNPDVGVVRADRLAVDQELRRAQEKGCDNAAGPAYEYTTYLNDATQGDFVINGSVFGDQIALRDVRFGR